MNDELFEPQDPVIELPSKAEPDPPSVPDPGPVTPTAPPMEVIPVDEFFDRLAELLDEGEEDADPEALEDPEEAEELEEAIETVDGDVDLPVPAPDPVTGIVEQVVEHLLDMIVDLGKIEEHTKEIQLDVMTVAQAVDHPALTTPFEDYTVSEALLLFLLLAVFVSACARMLRGGFSWLRS